MSASARATCCPRYTRAPDGGYSYACVYTRVTCQSGISDRELGKGGAILVSGAPSAANLEIIQMLVTEVLGRAEASGGFVKEARAVEVKFVCCAEDCEGLAGGLDWRTDAATNCLWCFECVMYKFNEVLENYHEIAV